MTTLRNQLRNGLGETEANCLTGPIDLPRHPPEGGGFRRSPHVPPVSLYERGICRFECTDNGDAFVNNLVSMSRVGFVRVTTGRSPWLPRHAVMLEFRRFDLLYTTSRTGGDRALGLLCSITIGTLTLHPSVAFGTARGGLISWAPCHARPQVYKVGWAVVGVKCGKWSPLKTPRKEFTPSK